MGEPRLNSSPARAKASCSSAAIFTPSSPLWIFNSSASTSAPWRSILANTGTSGISMSISTGCTLGVLARRACSAWCRRKVMSASSAAYGPALSSGIWLNVSCFAPLPAICSKVMVLWSRYFCARLSMS
ncbi:hypothetical protein D3C71_1465810 [compost metagenome]